MGRYVDLNETVTATYYDEQHEEWNHHLVTIEDVLSEVCDDYTVLPRAQMEIIYCKDCKHSEHWYRDKRRCFLWDEDGIDVWDDGFCNYGKREQDG